MCACKRCSRKASAALMADTEVGELARPKPTLFAVSPDLGLTVPLAIAGFDRSLMRIGTRACKMRRLSCELANLKFRLM